MNASPTLLQMKYTRVVGTFAKLAEITLDEALRFFLLFSSVSAGEKRGV